MKRNVFVRLSDPMVQAIDNTAPADVAKDAWKGMVRSEKLRLIVDRWLRANGAKWEEPVYKPTGRPKGAKDSPGVRRPSRRKRARETAQAAAAQAEPPRVAQGGTGGL